MSLPPERIYDNDADRLFLVYYALPAGFNGNHWGVSPHSIAKNIHTAVNKPVVISRKNPNNPFHTKQAGAYIHPTPEEASSELGRINAQQYYNWQERYAVGRVRSVDKREQGYAFTLEITDPDVKSVLKSSSYVHGIPGFTSPQIISSALQYPEEARSEVYDHWSISHIALVDVPAYGKDQAGLRAKCLGTEKDCMITTRSASQENLDFCVKQATIDLVNVHSSHVDSQSTNSHTIMSTESTTPKSSETVTFTGTPTSTEAKQEQPSSPSQQQEQSPVTPAPAATESEQKPTADNNLSTKEQQMTELIREQGKQIKVLKNELDSIKVERKQARLSFIIPRDLFKTDESHQKEVQKAMQEDVPEPWLIEYWKTKRELSLAQGTAKKMEVEPLMAKSASVQPSHDVPDFSSSQNQNARNNVQKQLDLQRMILEGGSA